MSINTRAEVETSGNRPSLRPLIRQLRTLRALTPLSPDPSSWRYTPDGSGVKHLARIASRPVTWVIKIKHAGLGVLGQKERL